MRVAVYGTLRLGEGNWSWALRGNSTFVGKFRVPGFDMYSNGSYPYALPGGGEITVEVFEIDVVTLGRLDQLEGYPAHYNRKTITVGEEEAWIYFTEAEEVKSRCVQIPSGDWLEERKSVFEHIESGGD